MKCENVRARLSAYSDGELEVELHRTVAEHLNGCAECREEWEQINAIDTLLKRLPQPTIGAQFTGAVVRRVQGVKSTGRGYSLFHRLRKAMLGHCEKFLELLEPEARIGTRSLDEFSDLPASFIGYAYFRALGSPR